MGERGEPVHIRRSDIEHIKNLVTDKNKEDGISPKIPLLSTPDHVLESRGDCATTFLEEGLLPTIRDGIQLPTHEEVIELAKEFMEQFRKEHPNDFDLDDPIDLIAIASAQTFAISMTYEIRKRKSAEDGRIYNIVTQADDLIGEILEEQSGSSDNEEEN